MSYNRVLIKKHKTGSASQVRTRAPNLKTRLESGVMRTCIQQGGSGGPLAGAWNRENSTVRAFKFTLTRLHSQVSALIRQVRILSGRLWQHQADGAAESNLKSCSVCLLTCLTKLQLPVQQPSPDSFSLVMCLNKGVWLSSLISALVWSIIDAGVFLLGQLLQCSDIDQGIVHIINQTKISYYLINDVHIQTTIIMCNTDTCKHFSSGPQKWCARTFSVSWKQIIHKPNDHLLPHSS